jgi:signal transduction histidine kinase
VNGTEKRWKAPSSPWLRYSAAVVTVAVALLLTSLLQSLAVAPIYSLSFAAVILTAWYAGLGPGLLATALAGLALDYFFIGPRYSLGFDLRHVEQVSVFMVVAILIGYLTAARRRAEEELRAAHADLEIRVQERTKELARTNKELQTEVAERKEAEGRLAELARELEARNDELWRLQGEMGRVERLAALGRITGAIAHELGTPLNSVLGYAHLLAKEELSENAHRRLEIITTQVERMVEIINQYLSRTRTSFQEGRQVDVNGLVRETLDLLRPIFQQRHVQATAVLADSLPPIRGDAASLQRVLINLFDNAADAMDKEGEITVTTRVSQSTGPTKAGILICITDTGIGIPPELLPKIFEFFVTTKAPGQGTGMGLAVCQEIVKGHGGKIDITSQVGKGTAVQVFLPADEGPSVESSPEAPK